MSSRSLDTALYLAMSLAAARRSIYAVLNLAKGGAQPHYQVVSVTRPQLQRLAKRRGFVTYYD